MARWLRSDFSSVARQRQNSNNSKASTLSCGERGKPQMKARRELFYYLLLLVVVVLVQTALHEPT